MEPATDKPVKLDNTHARNYPLWLSFFRIALGLLLLGKGISFFHDSTSLEGILHKSGFEMFDNNAQTLSFIVTYANLLGGLFIAVGLLTKWASLVQVPILLVAAFFINIHAGVSLANTEFIVSFAALILLIVFVIKGSGPISADEFFRSYTYAGQEKGHTKRFFQ